ncbi:peptidoglycan-binding domain-containing protein [Bordetella genomosp. 13]|uniref:peptidoglycan-binding domain-containing protein n=1 Tax=Bordetella genomosp. 13 TaxID=463040 RepID=UPI001C930D6D|nr:peptidoglycan-binding domain-containing protein [Bordetella genomosp. 13]
MAAGENDKKEEGKGFAGLSSLVSDVDTTPLPAAKKEPAAAAPSAARPAPQSAQPQPQPSQRQTYQEPLPPSSGSSGGKWVLGIAAVIGVLWLIGQFNKTTTPPAPAYSPPASTAPSYSPPPQSQAPSRPVESKPPVSQDLLFSMEQIRYCLAEDIRLDAAKSAVNNYIDADVDRFNAMVADYNSRCSSFRYQTSNRGRNDLKSAQRDIEPYRSQLQSEGRSRFARSPTGALSPQAPSRPAPDATVQAIQRKLNELGYEAGTADGLMGRGTRSAIIAFQQNRGLAATGVADQALLLQLQRAPALTSTPSVDSRPVSSSVQLSSAEAASLEAACSTDKYVNGPAAYRACVDRQKAALAAGVRRPNLSSLSSAEQQSIEAACSTDKYVNGPAAYNQCLARQLSAMSGQGSRRPDLSHLSSSERQSIEAACSTDKYVNGPAAYNRCLNTQLAALDQQGGGPDLSRLSTADRRSIESACSTDKYVNGPAAYNRCLSQQLARLR